MGDGEEDGVQTGVEAGAGDPELSAEQAAEHLAAGDALFVDVRDAGSWLGDRIPGAIHVGDHNVAAFLAQADPDRRTIVVCYHGHNSLGGAAWFRQNGLRDVWSMRGGMADWWPRATERGPAGAERPAGAAQSETRGGPAPGGAVGARPASAAARIAEAPEAAPAREGATLRSQSAGGATGRPAPPGTSDSPGLRRLARRLWRTAASLGRGQRPEDS